MAEFVPINTQEEFDAAVRSRLQREREKYADYDSIKAENGTLKNQVSTLTGEKEALEKKVKGHETNSVKMRIAHETGIPYEMAMRLNGETEKDIRADAESMAKYIHKPKPEPMRSTEPAGVGDNREALRKMLPNLTP